MKESILIRNFGPIKEAEIGNIRPFTVFIGESGSGKSTIMKVLVLFRWLYKMLNIRSYLAHSNVSQASFTFDFPSYLNNNGLDDYQNENTEILYEKGGIRICYKYKKRLSVPRLIPAKDISLEKMCFVSDKRSLIPNILAGNKVEMSFFLNETYQDFKKANDIISEFSVDYLDIKYFSEKTQFGVKHRIRGINDPYMIDFDDASSGMQTVVPVSLVVEYFAKYYDFNKRFNKIVLDYLSQSDSLKDFRAEKNIGDIKHRNIHIHIEEPELSLYPESRRNLIDFIVNRCFIQEHNGYNMTVMMATHSPYIVNHLNLLIKAFDKNKPVNDAWLNYDDISAYHVSDGKLVDLKIKNERLICTNRLSDPINDIYDQYSQL